MALGHSNLKGLLLELPKLSMSITKSQRVKPNSLQSERTLLIRRVPVWGSGVFGKGRVYHRLMRSQQCKTDIGLAGLCRRHAKLSICSAQPQQDLGWMWNLAFGTVLEKRCGFLGGGPGEKNKEEQNSRRHNLRGEAEKVGVVQSGEERAEGKHESSFKHLGFPHWRADRRQFPESAGASTHRPGAEGKGD